MLQKRFKLLPIVLLVGMFSASCAMPTTTKTEKKKTETVDVSDVDRAIPRTQNEIDMKKVQLEYAKKQLKEQETMYLPAGKELLATATANLAKSPNDKALKDKVALMNTLLGNTQSQITKFQAEIATLEKELAAVGIGSGSSSGASSSSDQKALVDQLTKEIENLKYSKTSNENLLNPRSSAQTIKEANASLDRIKVKMAELELKLADAKKKCGQVCVDATANAVIDGYKKDYNTLKNDLATANNNINSNQKKFDDIKTEYFKKQVDPKTKEAKWSPNQVDMFMAPSREAEKQLAIWKDKKATIEKQMATIKEKCGSACN